MPETSTSGPTRPSTVGRASKRPDRCISSPDAVGATHFQPTSLCPRPRLGWRLCGAIFIGVRCTYQTAENTKDAKRKSQGSLRPPRPLRFLYCALSMPSVKLRRGLPTLVSAGAALADRRNCRRSPGLPRGLPDHPGSGDPPGTTSPTPRPVVSSVQSGLWPAPPRREEWR